MNIDQVAQLLYSHGFTGGDLINGICIVMVESRGNPAARHVNVGGGCPGSVDRGLWQFNNNPHCYSQHDGGGELPDSIAFDPDGSTIEAAKWKPAMSPWNGDAGSRLQWTQQAEQAAAKVYGPGHDPFGGNKPQCNAPSGLDIANPVAWITYYNCLLGFGGIFGGIADIPGALVALGKEAFWAIGWLTSGQNWIRLGEAVAGGLLILFALYLLAKKADVVPSVVPIPV